MYSRLSDRRRVPGPSRPFGILAWSDIISSLGFPTHVVFISYLLSIVAINRTISSSVLATNTCIFTALLPLHSLTERHSHPCSCRPPGQGLTTIGCRPHSPYTVLHLETHERRHRGIGRQGQNHQQVPGLRLQGHPQLRPCPGSAVQGRLGRAGQRLRDALGRRRQVGKGHEGDRRRGQERPTS